MPHSTSEPSTRPPPWDCACDRQHGAVRCGAVRAARAAGRWRCRFHDTHPGARLASTRSRRVETAAGSSRSCLPRTLQGGTVVNHDRQFKADVLIKDGLIAAVELDIKVGSDQAEHAINPACGTVVPTPEGAGPLALWPTAPQTSHPQHHPRHRARSRSPGRATLRPCGMCRHRGEPRWWTPPAST